MSDSRDHGVWGGSARFSVCFFHENHQVLPLHIGVGGPRADREFLRGFNREHEAQQGIREQVFVLRQLNPLFIIVPLVLLVLYFVSPWDLIPDSVPVVGLLDDLFFFVFVLVGFSWLTRRYRDNI